MDIRTRLRRHFESEKRKIAYLDTRGKLRYILNYYWLWILGVCGGLFLLLYIAFHALFAVKDYWFFGIFANTMADAGNGSALWRDFTEYAGFDLRLKKVEMNASAYFDPSVAGGTNNSYYQMFVAVTEAKDLDVLVMGIQGLQAVGSSGRLLDLSSDESAFIMEEYADRLVWCDPYDETYSEGQVPIGIDISDSLLVTKYHLYEGDCALGLGAYTQRPQSAKLFLEFILSDDETSATADGE